MLIRRFILLLAAAGVILYSGYSGLGCGGGPDADALADAPAVGRTAAPTGHGDADLLFPKLPKVTGHIDAVTPNPDNPRYFQRLRITDAAGKRWEFHAEGWAGVSAGHLQGHRIQGTPVTVAYEPRPDGTLRARFVGD